MSPQDQPLGRVLAGIETEYGLAIDGVGPDSQVEFATQFVEQETEGVWQGWDYRTESPRQDLRGFTVDRLAVDPTDAQFDQARDWSRDISSRADRILPNGARFYNDHGHPEYATPECFDRELLMRQDKAGEMVLMRCARKLQDKLGLAVKVYKNNTDFHGASYGCHESYLVPRSVPYLELSQAVIPMLIARIVLTGAGKAGSEAGSKCAYQLSARADFFSETANIETLFRRPIFNTRDEPHADPNQWQRLHVIAGDANMIPACTTRKVGLVQLAVTLAASGVAPQWAIQDPVYAIQRLSRTVAPPFEIPLNRLEKTTARAVLESYFEAWEKLALSKSLPLVETDHSLDFRDLIKECRELLDGLDRQDQSVNRSIDWCAKRHLLEIVQAESGLEWGDSQLQSYDLAYHNIDPEEGLYFALAEMGEVPSYPPVDERIQALDSPVEMNRAWVRGLAVKNFQNALEAASWGHIVFNVDSGRNERVLLTPEKLYDRELATIFDVGTFISCLKS